MSRPPRTVLLLMDDLHEWTGTEVHLFRLLQRLDQGRVRPLVAVLGRDGLAPEFRRQGIEVLSLYIRRALAPEGLWGALRIARLVRRERVDLLVTYHTAADLLGPLAARLTGRPVLSCRRDEGFTKKQLHVQLQRRLNWLLSGMISVSHAVARAVHRSEGYPLRRNQVIWNGEDLERFSPGPSPVRQELGLPDEALLITSVGLLSPIKDHATQLSAFALLAPRHPRAHLLIAGDGELRAELEQRAAPMADRVHFLGHRKDVPALLRASDAYLQTSHSEGFSNAILQAMGCALPVVVTAVGGNPELVTAETGSLVPAQDAAATAGALEALLADPERRQQMGRAARQRTLEHFTLDRMALSYADAFERATERRFPGPHSDAP